MKPFVAAAVLLVLAGLAGADLRFTEKASDQTSDLINGKDSKAPRVTVVEVKGHLVKFIENDDPTAKPRRVVIFDGTKQTQKDVNPRGKTFAEFGPDYLNKRTEDAKVRVGKLEDGLEDLTGEKKTRTEKLIWYSKKVLGLLVKAPAVEMTRTGEKQKIGVFDCERIVIKEEDPAGQMQVVFDCWMTEAAEGWTAYADMYSGYKAFSPGVLEKMKELKGIHVKGTFELFWLEGQLVRSVFDNSDAKVMELPDEGFLVPADYSNTSKK